ncbi:MAG: hypothetical protein K0S28_327 [Paucimonas sp.]|jgi:uncharacterized protein YjbJ (UPF0337 family)|nr:hypothetical protein [Paucimonas sp.]
MATIELGPGGTQTQRTYTSDEPVVRRSLFPAIRWGAIIAGVAVGVSLHLLLILLGVATGLSSLDVTEGDGVSGTAPLLWAGLSMLIAAFVGGYVAARMTGFKRKMDGVLHGAVSWAVTTLLFAMLATSAGGSLVSGIFKNVVPAAAKTASSAAGGPSSLASIVQERVGQNVDAATLRRFQDSIQAGRRDEAISIAQQSMNMERDNASKLVDQALIVSGSPEQASPQSQATADNALDTASKAAWAVFFAVALSLAVGIGGGILGSKGSRRTPWANNTAAA